MNEACRPSTCPATTSPSYCCAPAIPDDVDALVFDFDGTLANTTPVHEHALRLALRPHGVDLNHDWYVRHVGLSIHDLLAALPGGRQLTHDEIIRHSRTHLLATMHHITPISCVVSLLHAARRAGLPCAVASGASQLLVHPGLDALGLTDEFAAVVAREDVTHGKPAPDLYLEAARSLDIPPDHCLAIDDAPDGITAARAADMHVITVADGHLTPTCKGAERTAHLFASEAAAPMPTTISRFRRMTT
ncbi:HAD family phosphatase [Nonomuraea sp. K274]|uniref:HAD family phosphatase n=2 Tax=Nonomuraea cypriaca TaxID=1187855 RepID=A0A931A7K1_9ACTN|nr:HAD family phosphatase [Nonomuraea cypriaca]